MKALRYIACLLEFMGHICMALGGDHGSRIGIGSQFPTTAGEKLVGRNMMLERTWQSFEVLQLSASLLDAWQL